MSARELTASSLVKLVRASLARLDLAELVEEHLPEQAMPRVLAIGKGAASMARGAIAKWGSEVERCLVVVPDETDVQALISEARRARVLANVTLVRSAHPLPDARSVRAGRLALALAASAADDSRGLLVLVSGGASSLVCAPTNGISLRTKRAVARALLTSGVTVQDINVVRKHLSRIKGGGLLRAAGASNVLTLVASDVVGGTLSDVGSGPSVPDPSSLTEARAILRRHAPAFANLPLTRTVGPTDSAARRARAHFVASPERLARVVAESLHARGLGVRVLPPSQAGVEEMARTYVRLAERMRPGTAFVRAAEPSVTVPKRDGRGGRSTHLAALVGRELHRRALFLAFATDGVDGSSGTSGAIIDGHFAVRAGARALDDALARFDTGKLHRAVETALPEGPSGHNLADLHVLLARA
ncbi:D-glycerate 2-kinase [Labilithrix luteola]|uniref:D-glycerate 2-kinase n=1 Tax=Labilithrix luteola TaxID=1391654 RepID=A0A0K1Q317_9BACT|nr:DUF4147 domain-containing protein [Labilithrix luteola]AKU99774.1 D-glycerate 2-kinase [Labilithrix luteola]